MVKLAKEDVNTEMPCKRRRRNTCARFNNRGEVECPPKGGGTGLGGLRNTPQFWKNMCYFAVSLEVTVNTTEVGDLCLPSCLLLVPAWDIIFG